MLQNLLIKGDIFQGFASKFLNEWVIFNPTNTLLSHIHIYDNIF
jgi:hypothetical protein